MDDFTTSTYIAIYKELDFWNTGAFYSVNEAVGSLCKPEKGNGRVLVTYIMFDVVEMIYIRFEA